MVVWATSDHASVRFRETRPKSGFLSGYHPARDARNIIVRQGSSRGLLRAFARTPPFFVVSVFRKLGRTQRRLFCVRHRVHIPADLNHSGRTLHFSRFFGDTALPFRVALVKPRTPRQTAPTSGALCLGPRARARRCSQLNAIYRHGSLPHANATFLHPLIL